VIEDLDDLLLRYFINGCHPSESSQPCGRCLRLVASVSAVAVRTAGVRKANRPAEGQQGAPADDAQPASAP